MKIIRGRVKFTSQVILEKTAEKRWWDKLYPDHRYAAKMRERALAGTLKDEGLNKMMAHFKVKMVREPQEALWEEMELITYRVFSAKKDYGEIEAYTPGEAIKSVAIREMGDIETTINIEGEEQLKWELLQCILKAEEVK